MRAAAAVVWRARVRWSDTAYWRLAHRVSPRVRDANPRLWKLPPQWTSCQPLVHARRHGLALDLDLRDNLQAILYFGGTYEPHVLRFLERELRRGDVVADVGAHVGLHSLVAARRLRELGGGRVHAFEPAADSAEQIRRAARANRVVIDVVEAALADVTGSAELYADPVYDVADAGVRSLFAHGPLVQRVRALPFDAWADDVRLDRLDLVKIDVEGAELAVLDGMRSSLRWLRPRGVLVEVKPRTASRAGVADPQALRRRMADVGYESSGVTLDRNELFRPTRAG